jgi:hypothetical protein
MFRALLAYPQDALHKQHLVYCVRVMSVGCTRMQPTDITRTHYTKCRLCNTSWGGAVMLETCRGSWSPINWMKSVSRWFHYTDILICDILVCASAVVWTECWRSHRHTFCSTSSAVSCHIPLAVFGITRERSCLQLSTRSPLFIEPLYTLVRNQSIPVPTKSLTRKLSIWTDHLIFLTCLIPQWQTYRPNGNEIRQATNAFLLSILFTSARFRASAVVQLKFSLFWYVAGLGLVVGCRLPTFRERISVPH